MTLTWKLIHSEYSKRKKSELMTDGPTNQLINQQLTDMRVHREVILEILIDEIKTGG